MVSENWVFKSIQLVGAWIGKETPYTSLDEFWMNEGFILRTFGLKIKISLHLDEKHIIWYCTKMV